MNRTILAAALSLGPASAATAPVALTLDYRVPPRYGLDQNRDGLVDSITTPAQASPARPNCPAAGPLTFVLAIACYAA